MKWTYRTLFTSSEKAESSAACNDGSEGTPTQGK